MKIFKFLFKHDCLKHAKLIHHNFSQVVEGKVLFKQCDEYECKKCHKKWKI